MQDFGQSQLIGRNVESVSVWPGSNCVIEFGADHQLQIECLWRLRKHGAIILTSSDEGQFFGRSIAVNAMAELSDALVGLAVINVRIEEGSGDLVLLFGDIALEAISNSSGYEAWQLTLPAGQLLVAQGGGNVAVWDGEA